MFIARPGSAWFRGKTCGGAFPIVLGLLRNAFVGCFVLDTGVLLHLREFRAPLIRDAILAGSAACQAAIVVRYAFVSVALCSHYICHIDSPLPWLRPAASV